MKKPGFFQNGFEKTRPKNPGFSGHGFFPMRTLILAEIVATDDGINSSLDRDPQRQVERHGSGATSSLDRIRRRPSRSQSCPMDVPCALASYPQSQPDNDYYQGPCRGLCI